MGLSRIFKSFKKSRVAVNYLYSASYNILALIIPLVTIPYLTRVMGAESIGIYSVAYAASHYFEIFIVLGLNSYGNRAIAMVKDDREQLKKTFWSIYAMQFFLGLAVQALYIAYGLIFAADKTAALIMEFYVFSGMVDITWFFFGMEKFKLTVIRNTVIKLLTTAAIFVFVKSAGDVYIYCLIMTGGMAASQLVVWPYLFKEVTFYKPSVKEVTVHIKPNLLLFVTVIAITVYKYIDKIMLGAFAMTDEAGFYEVSEKIISVPIALIKSLGTVMLPKVSNMVANKQDDKGLLKKSLEFAMFLSASMCFGIMGVSREFVPVFFGKGYDECIWIFLILLPSCLFLAFGNVIRTQYMLPYKKDKIIVSSTIMGAIVNIIINYLMIPHYGAAGAAVGTFVTETAVCIYQCFYIRKEVPMRTFVIQAVPGTIAGIIMFAILFNVNLGLSNPVQLAVKIVIGAAIFFVAYIPMIKIKNRLCD